MLVVSDVGVDTNLYAGGQMGGSTCWWCACRWVGPHVGGHAWRLIGLHTYGWVHMQRCMCTQMSGFICWWVYTYVGRSTYVRMYLDEHIQYTH